jgi:hypothetical protein
MADSWAAYARMANSRVIKVVLNYLAALALVGLLALWANHKIHSIPISKREKLADCTSNIISFSMAVRYDKPYQFVLGVPHTSTKMFLSFHGEAELRQGSSLRARIPISSDDITTCNWLEASAGLSGYILTWSRTNRDERLNAILTRGQSYDVRFTFSQPPPQDTSLWLTSIGRAGVP